MKAVPDRSEAQTPVGQTLALRSPKEADSDHLWPSDSQLPLQGSISRAYEIHFSRRRMETRPSWKIVPGKIRTWVKGGEGLQVFAGESDK